jgi:hypothetical protein
MPGLFRESAEQVLRNIRLDDTQQILLTAKFRVERKCTRFAVIKNTIDYTSKGAKLFGICRALCTGDQTEGEASMNIRAGRVNWKI